MTRIRRSTGVRRSVSPLHRKALTSQYTAVSKIDPIDPDVSNVISDLEDSQQNPAQSMNLAVVYDKYYESVDNLKEEFSRFYHSEQAMSKALKHLDENPHQFSQNMQDLISQYNLTLEALHHLDQILDSQHANRVIEYVRAHQDVLEEFGFSLTRTGQILLNRPIFQTKIIAARVHNRIGPTFEPLKTIILSAYRLLRGIRLQDRGKIENPYQANKKYHSIGQYEKGTSDLRGYIYEKKL